MIFPKRSCYHDGYRHDKGGKAIIPCRKTPAWHPVKAQVANQKKGK